MIIKKSTLYLGGILFLIALASYVLATSKSSQIEKPIEEDSREIQNVILSIKNYNYYPTTITVAVNKPVRIYLDASVSGCLRSFTIPELGIAKNLRTPQDYVEFTPTKPGTYLFACSMRMGTGTLIVE